MSALCPPEGLCPRGCFRRTSALDMPTSYLPLALDDAGQSGAAQRQPTRRRWLVGLAAVGIGCALVALLVGATAPRSPGHGCVELSAPSRDASYERRSSWNGLAFGLHPSCSVASAPSSLPLPRCSIDIAAARRYEPLRGSASRKPVFIAALLSNSEAIVNVWIRELPALIAFLGAADVHVSIYESSSDDRTVERLAHLADVFAQIGASL